MLNVIPISQTYRPQGMDIAIRKFQESLYIDLKDLWNLTDDQFQSYGRIFRNKKENGYVAEWYAFSADGKSIEYQETYWDDKVSVVSFFGIGQVVKHDLGEKVEVHHVYFVDLKKIKPAAINRADEEIRKDVITTSQFGGFGFNYNGFETGIENVLKEYPGSLRDNRLKYVDMHPVHCFRLNFTLNYNMTDCY
jgi:hypothetical protein